MTFRFVTLMRQECIYVDSHLSDRRVYFRIRCQLRGLSIRRIKRRKGGTLLSCRVISQRGRDQLYQSIIVLRVNVATLVIVATRAIPGRSDGRSWGLYREREKKKEEKKRAD